MQKTIIKGGESLSSSISLWNTRHFALDIPPVVAHLSGGEDVSIGVLLKE